MEPLKSLASTGIGKVMMWIIAVLVAVIVGMSGWVYILKDDVKVAEYKKDEVQTQLDAVMGQLMKNEEDHQRRLANATKTNVVIRTRYIEKVKNIIQRVDSNVTCNDAMSDLNLYQY